MRVTEGMALRDFLRDLEATRQGMLEAQYKSSTGKRIQRPSDNPTDASDILRLKADKSETDQYERNLEYGRSKLQFTDTAFSSLQDMIERVRFLALSAIGSPAKNDAFSTEVEGLRDQILGTLNSAFQGRYIFGGSDGETQPFQKDASGVVTYNGNDDVVTLQIGRASRLQTQIPGDQLFGSVDLFAALTDLVGALQTGDTSQIDARLKPIESAWESLSINRSRVGNMINVADSRLEELTAMSLARETNLDHIESVNLAEALTEFQSYQNALQSTLAVGARISQLTLLDYL